MFRWLRQKSIRIGSVFQEKNSRKFFEIVGGIDSNCQGSEIVFKSLSGKEELKENSVWVVYPGKWTFSFRKTFGLVFKKIFA